MGINDDYNQFRTEKNVEKQTLNSDVNLLISLKSYYILENIFSFLYERKKLDLIIYNKKYKKKLGLSIDDYKKISGRKFKSFI